MPVGAREGLVGLLVHRERRRDVQQHQAPHRLGVVERQPVRHARAAIVRQHVEARAGRATELFHADALETEVPTADGQTVESLSTGSGTSEASRTMSQAPQEEHR